MRWFFKELLTEWFFVEPKMVLLWHLCEEPFEAPLFLRVYSGALDLQAMEEIVMSNLFISTGCPVDFSTSSCIYV